MLRYFMHFHHVIFMPYIDTTTKLAMMNTNRESANPVSKGTAAQTGRGTCLARGICFLIAFSATRYYALMAHQWLFHMKKCMKEALRN